MTDEEGDRLVVPSRGQRRAYLLLMPLAGTWIVVLQEVLTRLRSPEWEFDANGVVTVLAIVWCGTLVWGVVSWRLFVRPTLVIASGQLRLMRGALTMRTFEVQKIHGVWAESELLAKPVFIEYETPGRTAIRRLPVPADITLPGFRNSAFDRQLRSLREEVASAT